tara:strand:- start:71 stop:649 length:579 start_codon:yes stop_codon:yes gene_type:complete
MWMWSSREIPDLVGAFDPKAILDEADGRPFIIEYLNTSYGVMEANRPSPNAGDLKIMTFIPSENSSDTLPSYVTFFTSIGDLTELKSSPFFFDSNGVPRNQGFVQLLSSNYDEVYKGLFSWPRNQVDYNDPNIVLPIELTEEGLVKELFAYNRTGAADPNRPISSIPIRITFAGDRKPYASINRWYLPSHLG